MLRWRSRRERQGNRPNALAGALDRLVYETVAVAVLPVAMIMSPMVVLIVPMPLLAGRVERSCQRRQPKMPV